MIPKGTFQCAICEERHISKHKRVAFRSYFPEKRINVCEYCIHDFRTSPEYEHLRPDIDPTDIEKIRKIREHYKDTHIYF